MKTFGIIMLVILLLLIGGTVFIVLNRPANLLIRKTFKTLTGLEIVSAKAYEQARADNVILEQQQISRQMIIDSLLNYNDEIQNKLIIKELRNKALEARVISLNNELSQAKELFDAMTINNHMIEFDLLTDGSKPTFLSEYQGHEVAIAEPSRISDAAWKIHEGNVAKEKAQIQGERTEVISDQLSIVQNINTNLNDALQHEREQRKDEVQKRENCEQAQSNTLKKAKGIAGAGIVSLLITIAIIIL
jgi:hypothetical protein